MEIITANIRPEDSAGNMPLWVLFDVVLSVIGVVAFIKLFRPSQESAWEISRQTSKKGVWGQFLAGLALGLWLLFWAAGVLWTGKFSPYKGAGFYITRETHEVLFWLTPGTFSLLGVDVIGHSIRKLLRYRQRASVLKCATYLQ